jgi:Ni,Fe-hydrogenase I small subunit
MSVIIPNTVVSIGACAFWGCISLATFTIPDSVVKIGSNAFRKCDLLTSIFIPASVIEISTRHNISESNEITDFPGCPAVVTVHPDNPVYTIKNGKLKKEYG